MTPLGAKTTLKLLKILFEDPLREFKEIELIKKAKTGKGSAGNLINGLIKENILLGRRIGKVKIIQLNMGNQSVFLLKNLFDREKIRYLSDSKLASTLQFADLVRDKSELILLFGSCVSGTASQESDIDLMVVSSHPDRIENERKKVEELFGERFNLHYYTKGEIMNKIKHDAFVNNALFKGLLFHGYDLARELFSKFKDEKELERLFFFNDRMKAALRNYLSKDYKATKGILDITLEQIYYYLLSEKGISYTSKKDVYKSIKKLPEYPLFQKMDKSPLKEKIALTEKFILKLLREDIIRGKDDVR